jgi:DNA-binding NtrC family response regulator
LTMIRFCGVSFLGARLGAPRLEADSRDAAIAQLRTGRVEVVVCDLHLPPDLDGISEGLAIIEAARAARPSIPVVVITGSNSRQIALEAIRCGAYGFFEKPFSHDEVSHIVRQAARVRHLEEENLKLRATLGGLSRLRASAGQFARPRTHSQAGPCGRRYQRDRAHHGRKRHGQRDARVCRP